MKNPGEGHGGKGGNENFYQMTDWDTLSAQADEFNAKYGENAQSTADDEAYQKKLEEMAQRDESFDELSDEQMAANETNSRVTDENGNPVERSSSMFEIYPRQQGESSKDYGERLKEVNRGRRLEYSVQADSPELRRKLEDMSQRDSSYDALSDAEISANETNTGINARGEEYTRNSSTFDRYPRQQGESSADYGSRIRWMNQMEKLIADNPQQDGESRDDYSARLESLGAVTLEDFRNQENAAEDDAARREKLREIVREHPRNEGENTFDYAQRIYDETGVKIGDHINTGERPSFVDQALEQSSEQDIEPAAVANKYHMKSEAQPDPQAVKPENKYHLKSEDEAEASQAANKYHIKSEVQPDPQVANKYHMKSETPVEQPVANKYSLKNENESVVDWATRNEMPAGAENTQEASKAEQLERRKLALGALADRRFADLLTRDGIKLGELNKLTTDEAEALITGYMAELENQSNQSKESTKAESVAETGNHERLIEYLNYEENRDALDKMGITMDMIHNMSDNEIGLLIDKMNSGEVIDVTKSTAESENTSTVENANEASTEAAEKKEMTRAEKVKAIMSRIGSKILSFFGVKFDEISGMSDEKIDELNTRVEKASNVKESAIADFNGEASGIDRHTKERWNNSSEAERRLLLSGQFDSFGAVAAGKVADVLDYVDLGIIDKDPENIVLPENDYGFETSQAALGNFESVVDFGGNIGPSVTKVEFSRDEIEQMIYDAYTKLEVNKAIEDGKVVEKREVVKDEEGAEKAIEEYMENVELWNNAPDDVRNKFLSYEFNIDEVRDDPIYKAFMGLTTYSPFRRQMQAIGSLNYVRDTRKEALRAAAAERNAAKNNQEAADSFAPITGAEDVRNIMVSDNRLNELMGRELTSDEMHNIRDAIAAWNMLDNNYKADVLKGSFDYTDDADLENAMKILRENGLLPNVESGDVRSAEEEAKAEPGTNNSSEERVA